MKKYSNGQYYDLTKEELLLQDTASKETLAQERHSPCSSEEALRIFLQKQLNEVELDDQTSLRMTQFYPHWEDLLGRTAEKAGFKFTCDGQLYKTRSPGHTFSSEWMPGLGTESLYVRINESYAGDRYDPIPYDGNMALEMGLYYRQDGTLYLCTRDTEIPVYTPLSELSGIYLIPAQ